MIHVQIASELTPDGVAGVRTGGGGMVRGDDGAESSKWAFDFSCGHTCCVAFNWFNLRSMR